MAKRNQNNHVAAQFKQGGRERGRVCRHSASYDKNTTVLKCQPYTDF